MANEVAKLPSLQELHLSPQDAFKADQFNLLLNQEPPKGWISQNKYAGNSNYLPIEKVEFLLTRIFQKWRVEVINYSQLFNAVSCHVRLHYLNPTTGEWSFHDGLGAVGIQTESGKPASDLSSIKQDSVMKALPAAKSYAMKDAADHLGKLFGRDLNRKDVIPFTGAYTKVDTSKQLEKLANGQ